jgi:hypothetical protein
MSVRGLQLLVVALCALAVPMVTTIAVVAAAFARAALQSSGPVIAERAWIAVVALVLFNAYLAATYGFRETFSKRRSSWVVRRTRDSCAPSTSLP